MIYDTEMGKTELYRHFIDIGAAAVIAMHTHCPQGYEIYNGAPIVYSMGNFFFPHAKPKLPNWYIGYMSVLDITESGIELSTVPYEFDFDGIRLLKDEKLDNFRRYLSELNGIIADEKRHIEMWNAWCVRWGIGCYLKRVIDPEKLGETSEYIHIKNIFSCEAHNELIKDTLNLAYRGKVEEASEFVEYTRELQKPEI